MTLDEINSKNAETRNKLLIEYYKNQINIDSWLFYDSKYSIIRFKNRIEYKKSNQYHRLNGPAIDFNDEKLDQYYFKGILYKNEEEWKNVTLKEIRKYKIKNLLKNNN